jgi:hypothetical protein
LLLEVRRCHPWSQVVVPTSWDLTPTLGDFAPAKCKTPEQA